MDVRDNSHLACDLFYGAQVFQYRTHPIARNEVEGGSTEKDVNPPTYLIEPQGKIKI